MSRRPSGHRSVPPSVLPCLPDSPSVKILTGDFNAEPHEDAYGCLTGRCQRHDPSLDWNENFAHDNCPCEEQHGPYLDSWLHSERESRASRDSDGVRNGSDKSSAEEREGFTYPPCKPEKRIDFILVRNQTVQGDHRPVTWTGRIESSWLAGQEVTAETGQCHTLFFSSHALIASPPLSSAHLASNREGLGMLDADSPIWASDHFAVVTDIQLTLSSPAPAPAPAHP
jgi:hypothetical protein